MIFPNRIYKLIIFLGIVNFLSFMIMAVYMGGDAVSGKIIDGHYFLSSNGKLIETTESIFNYSLWHTRSIFITHPLIFICGIILNKKRKKQYLKNNSNGEEYGF